MKVSEKIDKHTHVPKEKLVLKPPFPDAIKIELTSKCNYKCEYCAVSKSLRPTGNMNKEFLYRILREAKSIGVKEIGMFLLGESFLVKDIPEYIKYAKDVGIEYVFITTNGSLCTPKRLEDVINAGLDSLKFSVNAGEKERYKKLTGVDGFDKVVSNIKWLYEYKKQKNIKLKTTVSMIYNPEFKKEQSDFKKMISKYVDEFYYLPLLNQAGHVSKSKYVGNPGRLDNLTAPVPCWMLFNSGKITWDGYMSMCCFDHKKEFEIADLNKVSLMQAWHHPKFIELRKKHLENNLKNSLCAKCLGLK